MKTEKEINKAIVKITEKFLAMSDEEFEKEINENVDEGLVVLLKYANASLLVDGKLVKKIKMCGPTTSNRPHCAIKTAQVRRNVGFNLSVIKERKINMKTKSPEILHTAIRQYRHNNSDGLVFGFDYDETTKIVNGLLNKIKRMTDKQKPTAPACH